MKQRLNVRPEIRKPLRLRIAYEAQDKVLDLDPWNL